MRTLPFFHLFCSGIAGFQTFRFSRALDNPEGLLEYDSGSVEHRKRTRRRHSNATECTLYLTLTEYTEETEKFHDERSWSCELPISYNNFTHDANEESEKAATENVGDSPTKATEMMMRFTIEGLDSQFFEDKGAISGQTMLKISEGFIHGSEWGSEMTFGSLDDRTKMPSEPTLVVPPTASVELIGTEDENDSILPEDNEFYTRGRRRRLKPESIGALKTLVIRVIDKSGKEPSDSLEATRKNVFDDPVCMKSQFAACSKDQLKIKPFNGKTTTKVKIKGGVVDLQIDVDADQNRVQIQNRARALAEKEFGIIEEQVDVVMYCFPPGTESDWIGFAIANGYESFYNNKWCGRVSIQLHEVGHNLGLAHSGERIINSNREWYQDQSGMMGFSYNSDDAPKMCFNSAKSYQLNWYSRQSASLDPTKEVFPDSSRTLMSITNKVVMNGVCDYKVEGETDGKLVTLRLEDRGRSIDYYLGYNRACGANAETQEDENKINIVEKPSGGPNGYGQSWKLGVLEHKNQVHILELKGKNRSFVEIKLLEKTNVGKTGIEDAPLEITSYLPAEDCPGGLDVEKVTLRVKGMSDNKGHETSWKLKVDGKEGGYVAFGSGYRSKEKFREFYDLCVNECYVFEINDTEGNGLNGKKGGYISLTLDGAEIYRISEFDRKTKRHRFCVDPPTCVDSAEYNKEREKRNCDWVAKQKFKRCNRMKWNGKRLRHWCPRTCGMC